MIKKLTFTIFLILLTFGASIFAQEENADQQRESEKYAFRKTYAFASMDQLGLFRLGDRDQ